MHDIYQLRIALNNSKPEIYRTIQLDSNTSFMDLHFMIQAMAEWEGIYEFEFRHKNKLIVEFLEGFDENEVTAEETLLFEAFKSEKDDIHYCYDLEVNEWKFTITLEKILSTDDSTNYPRCIAGKNNFPPEEYGGTDLYNQALTILKIPNHKNYEAVLADFPENFDPAFFNPEETNENLRNYAEIFYENEDLLPEPEIQEPVNYEAFPIDAYSKQEIENIIFADFENHWPIVFKPLSEKYLDQVPILNIVHFIMTVISEEGEIGLTAKGNFRVNLVKKTYSQGFLPEVTIEDGYTKISSEDKVRSIHLAHILLQQSKIIKKRKNKISLTNFGKKLLKNKNLLLHNILQTYCTVFNWAYFDSHDNPDIGQFGFGYTLFLLANFGDQKRPVKFYSDIYFDTLPVLRSGIIEDPIKLIFNFDQSCYFTRTFDQFCKNFGLTELFTKQSFYIDQDDKVKKSQLFDQLISIMPPALLSKAMLGIS